MSTAARPRSIAASVLSEIRLRPGASLVFALAFRLVDLAALAPLSAAALRMALARGGRYSVGNFEIAAFFLTPTGLAAGVALGSVALAIRYLEVAGLMRLLADRRLPWWRALAGLGPVAPRVATLGLYQVVGLLGRAAPFLAAIGLVYWATWSGRDPNGLLILRPREFWIGAGLAGAIAAVGAAVVGRRFLRWLLALPAVLFEPGTTAGAALGLADARSRGRLARMAAWLAAWAAGGLGTSAGVLWAVGHGSEWLLERAGTSLELALPVTAAVLVGHAVAGTVVAILGEVALAALILAFHREAAPVDPTIAGPPAPMLLPTRWRALAVSLGVLAATGLACLALLRGLTLEDHLEITAHRAGATHAPENTVAALRRAIADGADWAEIDVQLTADRAIVVTHDTDLARLGGPPVHVGRSTLEQIRAFDVGKLFGPEFAGERVPTLAEILEAAGGRIGLNIELKPHGREGVGPLVEAVLAELRRADYRGRVRFCSQSYEAMRMAARLEPGLEVGFIAGAAIGDLARLEVDFLMVRSDLATRRLVAAAGARGIEVHAWTVNDPDQLARLLDRGVANLITDDPAAMRARLDEIHRLDPGLRLLLRARHLLADRPSLELFR